MRYQRHDNLTLLSRTPPSRPMTPGDLTLRLGGCVVWLILTKCCLSLALAVAGMKKEAKPL